MSQSDSPYLDDAPREVPSPWGGTGVNNSMVVKKISSPQMGVLDDECCDPAGPDD